MFWDLGMKMPASLAEMQSSLALTIVLKTTRDLINMEIRV